MTCPWFSVSTVQYQSRLPRSLAPEISLPSDVDFHGFVDGTKNEFLLDVKFLNFYDSSLTNRLYEMIIFFSELILPLTLLCFNWRGIFWLFATLISPQRLKNQCHIRSQIPRETTNPVQVTISVILLRSNFLKVIN